MNMMDDEAAKAAWLAKRSQPWGPQRETKAEAGTTEEEAAKAAKAAWLAKQNAGKTGTQGWLISSRGDEALPEVYVPSESPTPVVGSSEAEALAKAAWLAKLDAPTWTGAADQPLYSAPKPAEPEVEDFPVSRIWGETPPESAPDGFDWGLECKEDVEGDWDCE